ncbi:MAG: mannose-1-phosphate guanylyltransferase [Anaerolineales bacterium]|nr:mannose-1-phosphate guanylyltransferase [Anaerolineales bacterium]
MDHTYAIIMAGGSGTRLWPVSRRKHPKHVLPLLGERTLFQNTVDRLLPLVPVERILVVTAADQFDDLRRQAPRIPADNFLIEPQPRGTASVVGFAALVLAKRDPQAVMMVLPSDHYIRNRDLFALVMRVAVEVAKKDYLVTLGITPTFPSTGYGYIQRGASLPEKFAYPVYQVLRFKEKPDEETALELLAQGDHSWNSGMFIWRASRILDEFDRQMPNLKAALDRIGTAWGKPDQEAVLAAEWPQLHSETIDYGVMENAARVAVLPAGGLDWSDVGMWDSLFDVLLPDKNGNVAVNSDTLMFDTHKSLVYSTENKLVVTIGVDDVMIVDAGDALLVCHRDQAQQVRQVIDSLKNSGRENYL